MRLRVGSAQRQEAGRNSLHFMPTLPTIYACNTRSVMCPILWTKLFAGQRLREVTSLNEGAIEALPVTLVSPAKATANAISATSQAHGAKTPLSIER